ncbi:hypothetical protein B7R74_00170 [Yersinia pseudotuberculosis]|nr:hypothetical protein B7R74_00170 [Yersinia pseudotuberculosis]
MLTYENGLYRQILHQNIFRCIAKYQKNVTNAKETALNQGAM